MRYFLCIVLLCLLSGCATEGLWKRTSERAFPVLANTATVAGNPGNMNVWADLIRDVIYIAGGAAVGAGAGGTAMHARTKKQIKVLEEKANGSIPA